MISSLSARIQDILSDSLIVEVGGVGLQVYIPAPLKDRLSIGDNTLLYTHLVVREDALTLYGFESKDARSIYRLLLGVNGVGPRLALAVLSALSPDEIRGAVLQEREDVFNQVPGIGKKTAQKIIIHLQDKIPAEAGLAPISVLAEGDVEVVAMRPRMLKHGCAWRCSIFTSKPSTMIIRNITLSVEVSYEEIATVGIRQAKYACLNRMLSLAMTN